MRLGGRRRIAVGALVATLAVAGAGIAAEGDGSWPRPGANEAISVRSDGGQASGNAYFGRASADGRRVVFASGASDLVDDDTNGRDDIFVRDRDARTTRRVSVSTAGAQTDSDSMQPAITPDGRFVVFLSYATNLLAGRASDGMKAHVYVRD